MVFNLGPLFHDVYLKIVKYHTESKGRFVKVE